MGAQLFFKLSPSERDVKMSRIKRRIDAAKYLIAVAVAVVIFLFGYMASSQINSEKFRQLEEMTQDIRTDALSNEILFQLVQSSACETLNTTEYNLDLYQIGKRLTYMESLYGFTHPEVIRLKEYYSLLEIRHWLLSREINEKCGKRTRLVLYFYTNAGCNDCEDQGVVLTNIHNDYPVMNIYSFEYYLNNSSVEYLKKIYNITPNRLPTIVVDGKVYYGFQSKEELLKILNLSG